MDYAIGSRYIEHILKRSIELYAHHVIPHFSGVNVNRFDSYDWVTANQAELVEKRVNAANQMFAKHEAERAGRAALGPVLFSLV